MTDNDFETNPIGTRERLVRYENALQNAVVVLHNDLFATRVKSAIQIIDDVLPHPDDAVVDQLHYDPPDDD